MNLERVDGCDLCEAARITPWFHEDDICWIAECEISAVPMVVWRGHGVDPPPDQLAHMHERLAFVVSEHFEFTHYVDDNMRNIPDHYHAHAAAGWVLRTRTEEASMSGSGILSRRRRGPAARRRRRPERQKRKPAQ